MSTIKITEDAFKAWEDGGFVDVGATGRSFAIYAGSHGCDVFTHETRDQLLEDASALEVRALLIGAGVERETADAARDHLTSIVE